MELFKKLISEILSLPIMNPNIQKTAKHLSSVALYNLKGVDALQPEVKTKCVALIARMKALGKPVYLAQGFRTAAEQDLFYAKGRTASGAIVTDAKGGQSYHQYGLAFDLVFETYNWTPPSHEWWVILGEEGKRLGLEWGGSWTELKDYPHFEFHPNYSWDILKAYFIN